MTEAKLRKLVILMPRGPKAKIGSVLTGLRRIPGVEIAGKSKSFVDVVIDEDAVDRSELEGIVSKLGCEIHALPEAQLMDPIPTKKIP